MSCLFCEKKEQGQFVLENELAFAIMDAFPVSKGHMLIIPKRHVETYFDVTPKEAEAMKDLANKAKDYLDNLYKPDGYNIGLNCGEVAGQTVMHCHMHIIPRYKGDSDNPKGGIRKIINGNGNY